MPHVPPAIESYYGTISPIAISLPGVIELIENQKLSSSHRTAREYAESSFEGVQIRYDNGGTRDDDGNHDDDIDQ